MLNSSYNHCKIFPKIKNTPTMMMMRMTIPPFTARFPINSPLQTGPAALPSGERRRMLLAEVLRLDVSEGVRASLDCRPRRLYNKDAHL